MQSTKPIFATIILLLLILPACQKQSPTATPSPVPAVTAIKYPHADCEISTPEYESTRRGEYGVWILVAAEDMISISIDHEEKYRCQNIIPDPLTNIHHGFKLSRPEGEFFLQLKDMTHNFDYSEIIQIQTDIWIIINYGSEGRWSVRVLDEQPIYE